MSQMVIKPLDRSYELIARMSKAFVKPRGVTGAAILGDGNVGIILDVHAASKHRLWSAMISLEKTGNTLSLAGTLTVDEVAEARSLLLSALVDGESASLDLTRVEAIDARGAQLIASFLHTRAENRVEAVSASVDAFLSRIGARSLLGTST